MINIVVWAGFELCKVSNVIPNVQSRPQSSALTSWSEQHRYSTVRRTFVQYFQGLGNGSPDSVRRPRTSRIQNTNKENSTGIRTSYTYKLDSPQFRNRPILPRLFFIMSVFKSFEESFVGQRILILVLAHMKWLEVSRVWFLLHTQMKPTTFIGRKTDRVFRGTRFDKRWQRGIPNVRKFSRDEINAILDSPTDPKLHPQWSICYLRSSYIACLHQLFRKIYDCTFPTWELGKVFVRSVPAFLVRY